jgi:hypothetical protein
MFMRSITTLPRIFKSLSFHLIAFWEPWLFNYALNLTLSFPTLNLMYWNGAKGVPLIVCHIILCFKYHLNPMSIYKVIGQPWNIKVKAWRKDHTTSSFQSSEVNVGEVSHIYMSKNCYKWYDSKNLVGSPYDFPIRWSNQMGVCCGYNKWQQPRRIQLSLSL